MMEHFHKDLRTVLSLAGLFALNFFASLPAKASISCESGTINHHENGQLESCIISNNIKVNVSHPLEGSSMFTCLQKNYIYFDKSGQFQSCILSIPLAIKKGNLVEICPEKSLVSVSSENERDQFIRCRQLTY